MFDFHALRGQYITALVRSGAPAKVAQELARHSDPKSTFNVHTHLSVPDKQKARKNKAFRPLSPPTEANGNRTHPGLCRAPHWF